MHSLNEVMNKIKRKGIVYRITNKVTGETYIGATTTSLRSRWKQHKRSANKLEESPLLRAMRDYGSEMFSREVIASVPDYYYLVDIENAIIKQEKPTYNRDKPHRNQFNHNKKLNAS